MKKNIFTFVCVLGLAVNVSAETNSSARTGQALQIVGAAANAYQGKVYFVECTTTRTVFPCVLSAASFAQAAASLQAALQSEKTKNASDCSGPYCNGGTGPVTLNPNTGLPIGDTGGGATGTLPTDPTGDVLGRIQDDINRNLGNLSDQGYSYDAATNSIKTPGGNSVSASSLSSPGGLKGLGMTDRDIEKMEDIGKKALQEATKLADGLDMGGSGGGGRKNKGGPGYDDATGAFDMNKYLASLGKKKDDRGVAGLEKKYGSDHIGIAQDNIFLMINRRYQAKKSTLNP